MPIDSEVLLKPLLLKMKLRFTSIYFQNYVDDHNQKKTTLVIDTPSGITRDQIKQIEKTTDTRFVRIDIRESPLLDYQSVVEATFVRA